MNHKIRPTLLVVMDGVGERAEAWGNAVQAATTPSMDYLRSMHPFLTLKAHGRAVGLPSDADMGNSEVGHNALGSGQIFDQGAKLVDQSLDSGRFFLGQTWIDLVAFSKSHAGRLHLIGLFSDGNVHSHIRQLQQLCIGAKKFGLKEVLIHLLFDGRDVPRGSAEKYIEEFQEFIQQANSEEFTIRFVDGGGRMLLTMDRYGADWPMVQRGYELYTQGQAEFSYPDVITALQDLRARGHDDDQYIPSFVIKDSDGKALGLVQDGDAVVCYNFRGDRAMEISLAFTDKNFRMFPRLVFPTIFYAGMMQYDGDLNIPERYLVSPPVIEHTLSEWLLDHEIRQYACSETQKYGHVTYFWNGNRSGYLDQKQEEYLEIPSSPGPFDRDPWMKALEITEATVARMAKRSFDFGRINLANGDMVGHTGDFQAAILAVSTVDFMLKKLINAAKMHDYVLLVTADHGNADDMYMKQEGAADFFRAPDPKTAHSLSPVPFFVYDPSNRFVVDGNVAPEAGLANVAASVCVALGLSLSSRHMPSFLREV